MHTSVALRQVFRQKDLTFSSVLNEFRVGHVRPEAIKLLGEWMGVYDRRFVMALLMYRKEAHGAASWHFLLFLSRCGVREFRLHQVSFQPMYISIQRAIVSAL